MKRMTLRDEYVNKIECGDCASLMSELPPECIDLVVTSPPYDDLRTYNGYRFDFKAIAYELYQVIKPGGVVVWVVGDQTVNGSKSGNSMRQALHFLELGFYLHDEMVYQKNGPAYPSTNRYYQVWEKMYIFSKGVPVTFNPLKDRKNRWAGQKWSKKRTRRKVDGTLTESPWSADQGGEYGVRFNVWKYNVGAGYSSSDDFAHDHPAIYPEALANDHILTWSNPGELVLDPMCGSGTTLKMAKINGRQFLGYDISEEYCELSRKRIEAAQTPLFLLEEMKPNSHCTGAANAAGNAGEKSKVSYEQSSFDV